MALLKSSEVKKMDKKSRGEKITELRLELIKANVSANKSTAKTKEIKRAIARLMTSDETDKGAIKK